MKLTSDKGRKLVCGELPDWLEVSSNIVNSSVFCVTRESIFQHGDKYYKLVWTDYKTEVPFEYDSSIELVEVEPRDKIVRVYVEKD